MSGPVIGMVLQRVALSVVIGSVACPECAQQPGEWCATWDQLAGGTVARDGLVHLRRVEAYSVQQAAASGDRDGAVHVASDAVIDAAAEGLV